MKLIEEARYLGAKVSDLQGLYGLADFQSGDPERLQIAAHLLDDAMMSDGNQYSVTAIGRKYALLLLVWRRVFTGAVWLNFLLGWLEDNGEEDRDWSSTLHVDGEQYYVVPMIELACVAVHLLHCYLRATASIHW